MGLQPRRLGQCKSGPATGRLLWENGRLRKEGGRCRREEAGYGPGSSLKAGNGDCCLGASSEEWGTVVAGEGRVVAQASPAGRLECEGLGPQVCSRGNAPRASPLRETEGLYPGAPPIRIESYCSSIPHLLIEIQPIHIKSGKAQSLGEPEWNRKEAQGVWVFTADSLALAPS